MARSRKPRPPAADNAKADDDFGTAPKKKATADDDFGTAPKKKATADDDFGTAPKKKATADDDFGTASDKKSKDKPEKKKEKKYASAADAHLTFLKNLETEKR